MDQEKHVITHNLQQLTNTNTNNSTHIDLNIMVSEAVKMEPQVVACLDSVISRVQVGDSEVVVKRGRGRPRMIEGNVGRLDSRLIAPPPGFFEPYPLPGSVLKRGRGRPCASGSLQILASMGGYVAETGGSFTPYVVTVNTGEDVVSKILSFFQKGPRSVCIVSVLGPVSSVVIRQPGPSGACLKYEGHFEIISLSGSCSYTTSSDGVYRKEGMLAVSLAQPDGSVFGGGIESSMIAAGPIQLIMATFKQNIIKRYNMRYLPAPLPKLTTTTNGVQDGVTIATTNEGPEGLISTAATTTTKTNGVSPNVIVEDLNMISFGMDEGTSVHGDTSVPQI